MTLYGSVLGGRSLVDVSGPAARDFLQGIVTVDIGDVQAGTARNGALLTPQGKILFEFIISVRESGYLLDVASELAGELVKRLLFYRLRAKADVAQREDLAVAALWGAEDAPSLPGLFPDPRLGALGWRAVLPATEIEPTVQQAGISLVSEEDYHARRIALGVAELGRDYSSGEIFPHEADLDQLSGVDFDKGCFVGQEVVSRMQHRGTARKRFVPVLVGGRLPAPGSAVTAGGTALGTTGSAADGHALALLRLDRLADAVAAGQQVEAGGAALDPIKPDWARFDWPGGAGA